MRYRMTMREYLDEIEYAAENLITIIWNDYNELKELKLQLDMLNKAVLEGY